MALETVTHISDLVVTNPTATDPASQGDDHIRNIKKALKNSFPNVTGPVTATHTQLNDLPGQASTLDSSKADKATILIGGDGIADIGDLSEDRTISVDNTVVRTSGDQTVAGVKTFNNGANRAVQIIGAGIPSTLGQAALEITYGPEVVDQGNNRTLFGFQGRNNFIRGVETLIEGSVKLTNAATAVPERRQAAYRPLLLRLNAKAGSAAIREVFALPAFAGVANWMSSAASDANHCGG